MMPAVGFAEENAEQDSLGLLGGNAASPSLEPSSTQAKVQALVRAARKRSAAGACSWNGAPVSPFAISGSACAGGVGSTG